MALSPLFTLPPARLVTTMTSSPSPWRVLVTRRLPAPALEVLRSIPVQLDIWDQSTAIPSAQLSQRLVKADALCCTLSDAITAPLLHSAPRLKVISTVSVGFNHIALDECTKRHIKVGYTPNVLTETTADTVVGLVLAACRRFNEATNSVRDGSWGEWQLMTMCGMDVHGSVVGIVGMGRIGQAVAKRLKAFGCSIVYTARSVKKDADQFQAEYVTLDRLLQISDIVIPLCPLTDATREMFDQSVFRQMKPSAVFVNAARGELVKQPDLVRALKERWIFAAGLDVTTPEPLPLDSELLQCDNCFILPHIGSASIRTRTAMAVLAAKNLVAAYHGTRMPHQVPL